MKKIATTFAALGIAAAATAQTHQLEPIPYVPGAPSPMAAYAPGNWGARTIANAVDSRFGIGPGLDANGLHDTHADNMWLIGSFAEGPFPETWYCVDLGEEVLLAAIKLWNYNEGGWGQRGIRDVEVYVAPDGASKPDNGAAPPFYDANDGWSLHASHAFEIAPGNGNYPGCAPLGFKPVRARWAGLRIKSTHHAAYKDDRYVGISKIQFFSTPLAIVDTAVDFAGITNAVLAAEVLNNTGAGCDIFAGVAPASAQDWDAEAVWFAVANGFAEGPVSHNFTGLVSQTAYLARFVASNETASAASPPIPFKTFNAAPSIAVFPPEPLGGTHATLRGQLEWAGEGFETADVWLYLGGAEEGGDPEEWTFRAPVCLGAKGNAESFDAPVDGLYFFTQYRYCLLASNDVDTAWSGIETFMTMDFPQPEITGVTFEFTPGTTNALVQIAEPGINPVLIFVWSNDGEDWGDSPALWPNLSIHPNPGAGENSFTLPGVEKNETRAWRVFIGADGGKHHGLSGKFTKRYVFTWIEPNGGNYNWTDTNRWDLGRDFGLIPNGVGDQVVLPDQHLGIDIAGVGETLTLGGIFVEAIWGNIAVTSGDGTPIVWDNGAEPAFIIQTSWEWRNIFIMDAPQVFTGEMRVTATDRWGQSFPVFAGTSLTGPGPITVEEGGAGFGAFGGKTNRVEVAFNGGPYTMYGGGTVLFDNRSDTFGFGGSWWNRKFIGGGLHLLLDNGAVITNNGDGPGRFFMDEGNTLEITGGSKLFYSVMDLWFDNVRGNAIHVRGPGSELHVGPVFCCGREHVFSIEDGGLLFVVHNGSSGWFHFRNREWLKPDDGGNDKPGYGNKIRVASARPGEPSMFDLNNNDLLFNAYNCELELLPGGVATNAAEVAIGHGGTTGNRVLLAGGELHCQNFAVHAGNTLAPVIGADGIRPVSASVAASFEEGSKIAPVHGAPTVFGRWVIVKSPEIIAPPDLNDPAFLEPSPRASVLYKLARGTDADGTPVLVFSCFKQGSLFMVR